MSRVLIAVCSLVLVISAQQQVRAIDSTLVAGNFIGAEYIGFDDVDPGITGPTFTQNGAAVNFAGGIAFGDSGGSESGGLYFVDTNLSVDLSTVGSTTTVTYAYDPFGLISSKTTSVGGAVYSMDISSAGPSIPILYQGGTPYALINGDNRTTTPSWMFNNDATKWGELTRGASYGAKNSANEFGDYSLNPDFSQNATFGMLRWFASTGGLGDKTVDIDINAMSIEVNPVSVESYSAVMNGSFESPDTSNFSTGAVPTGWSVQNNTSGASTVLVDDDGAAWAAEAALSAAADGNQIMLLANRGSDANIQANMSQLAGQMVSGIEYTATIDAALWNADSPNGQWALGLYTLDGANIVPLMETAILPANLVNDAWTEVAVSYTAGGADVGDDLYVGIRTDYAPINAFAAPRLALDNVQVTVPEPASLALLGLGGLMLIRRKRK